MNELGGKSPEEFPMRFTPFARDQGALEAAVNCFIISAAEHSKLMTAFPGLSTPITLSPNGVNQLVFSPKTETREEVLATLSTVPYEGSPEEATPVPATARRLRGRASAASRAHW